MFALAVAMTHQEVRKLQATQLGAFLGIALAAMNEGFDPFAAPLVQLHHFGRVTPTQWPRVKNDVLKALRAALPDLVQEYKEKMENRRTRIKSGAANLRAYHASKRNVITLQPVSIVENSYTPGIFQPTKAPRHTNPNTDMQARQIAKTNKNKGIALHD